MKFSSYNQVVVNIVKLKGNYEILHEKVESGVFVLAMVKGDGYGHGMIEVSHALQELGCLHFGVAEIQEGVLLRQAGIKGTIYVMIGCDSSHAQHYFEHDLTPVVFSDESVEVISRAALGAKKKIAVHLKIDSGMNRLGCMPKDAGALMRKIEDDPLLNLVGVMSHFPSSDNLASNKTLENHHLFQTASKQAGFQFTGVSHIANSGGLLNFPETHGNMVRPGIALYGYYPDGPAGRGREKAKQLMPVMTFTTQVLQVKDVPEGTGISYGHTYVTSRATTLAVLPVGYEDGYPRCLSNCGEVLIQGCRAPILGRVCMNLCMVDITEIDGVKAGDEVVLLGVQKNEEITADDLADWSGTISYEILCMIGNNNQRSYI